MYLYQSQRPSKQYNIVIVQYSNTDYDHTKWRINRFTNVKTIPTFRVRFFFGFCFFIFFFFFFGGALVIVVIALLLFFK